MTKIKSAYTYDSTRKLGSLTPLEAEKKEITNKDISTLLIDQIRFARGEKSWTHKDIKILKAATICEVSHFYRALKDKLKNDNNENLVENIEFDRDEIVLEVMKGSSVREAFINCCGVLIVEALAVDN